MSDVLSPARARRVYLTLTFTRWFPAGLVAAIFTLWFLEGGLALSQVLLAFSLTGVVVFLLELPTGGFADVFGRRPVQVVAAAVNVAASGVLIVADAFWTFALATMLQGVFRALDSGPLEAWYVDTVHATEPGADVDAAMAAEGTVFGISMASGAVLSGGLILWHPFESASALLLPVVCWTVLNVVHLVAVVLWMREPSRLRPDTGSRAQGVAGAVRDVPSVVRGGLALLGRNRVLRSLVLAQVFGIGALVVFETFQPVRLAELVGGTEPAGALMGPVAAVGFAVLALGSTLGGRCSRGIGVAWTAMAARTLKGAGAVVMGLVGGPVALVAAYLFTYGAHGASGPMHAALIHREADATNRATVVSMDSMSFFVAFAVVAPLAGLLADTTSTHVAMVAAGGFSLLGVFLYLPALRAERTRVTPAGAADHPGPQSEVTCEDEPRR